MGGGGDFLSRLRALNVDRCEKVYHPLHDMNVLEWAACVAGEAGEAANAAKKLHWQATKTFVPPAKGDLVTREDVAEEIADTVIYADLLLASLGLSLEEAIRKKFNEKSKKHGYEEKL